MFTYWLGSRIPIPPEKPASRKAGGGGRRDGSKPLGRIVGFPESDPLPERGADFALQVGSCSAHPGPEDSARWYGSLDRQDTSAGDDPRDRLIRGRDSEAVGWPLRQAKLPRRRKVTAEFRWTEHGLGWREWANAKRWRGRPAATEATRGAARHGGRPYSSAS